MWTPLNKKVGKVMSKYPDVQVDLVGEDGNAMAIMARVSSALRRAGVSREERDAYYEQSTSGDYDNVLRVAMEWVEVN
tara:strand:+ start:148 stop:381 length:234 start_codon:yes stop_codon:yes gene_type:complete